MPGKVTSHRPNAGEGARLCGTQEELMGAPRLSFPGVASGHHIYCLGSIRGAPALPSSSRSSGVDELQAESAPEPGAEKKRCKVNLQWKKPQAQEFTCQDLVGRTFSLSASRRAGQPREERRKRLGVRAQRFKFDKVCSGPKPEPGVTLFGEADVSSLRADSSRASHRLHVNLPPPRKGNR
ncbi:uncharacterized protein isoform X3 [Castor canadensis]|uniref:Uncharacterized protein isoform X3 n=1 Tax=Castor canadensis TaxID=51338 RepID=A0AC58MYY4_CASCN